MRKNNFIKTCLFAIGAFCVLSSGMSVMQATPVSAKSKFSSCNASLLGVPAWYNNISTKDKHGNCNIVSPKKFGKKDGIQTFILRIAINVVTMLLMIAGYVCVGFVIYGGIKYSLSAGSSDGMSKAKQTIMNAFIGLIVSFMSVGIINAVFNILN